MIFLRVKFVGDVQVEIFGHSNDDFILFHFISLYLLCILIYFITTTASHYTTVAMYASRCTIHGSIDS